MKKTICELLAPAGSFDAFTAALAGGADAVYLAGNRFNARAGAKNFTDSELAEAFRLARLYNKKIYITLNTLVFDREINEALSAAENYLSLGARGFIIQDIGLASALKALCPDIELHASTQMTASTPEAAKLLAGLGFTRMVASRELDREGLISLCEKSPIETEYFVHGALCVCHSGQCLFSSVVGKRSGNAGLCAQPCRMEYTLGGRKGYALSLKDSCLAAELKTLKEAGVACLKIEGRMKSPEYVFGVTSLYRRLLDENRLPTADESGFLARLFSRGGFTDDYFRKNPGRDMFGYRTESDKKNTAECEKLLATGNRPIAKIPADMRFFANASSSSLELSARGERVIASGPMPEAARSMPMNENSVLERLSKLGNTPFSVQGFTADIAPGLNLSPAALNDMRRRAAADLEERLTAFLPLTLSGELPETVSRPAGSVPEMRIVFESSFALDDRMREDISITLAGRNYRFYLPLFSDSIRKGDGILMPPVFLTGEEKVIFARLKELKKLGITEAICTNIGFIGPLAAEGFSLHGSYRLNVTNSRSLALLSQLGFSSATISPECPDGAIRAMKKPLAAGAFIYGRLPLMTLENCLISNASLCPGKAGNEISCRAKTEMTDRTGAHFEIIASPFHRNLILNSLPSWRCDTLATAGLSFVTLYITTEAPADAISAIKAVSRSEHPSGSFTRR